MIDLSTQLGKIKLKNPTVLAAGILGSDADSLLMAEKAGAGAVTTKSIGPEEKPGHNNPTVLDYGSGLINAVGLSSCGYKNMGNEFEELKKLKIPLIASIYADSVARFVEVAEAIDKYEPAIIELNISCPNTEKEGMVFGVDKDTVHKVVSKVKNVVSVPLMPKLTPNCLNIAAIAKSCEEAGADMIAAINTVGPGMVINIEAKKPILHFKTGGLSGPAIKPVAVRCVYDIYEAVDIPVLGMGGVTNGKDAIEMLMAGASAVGIGSAVYYRGTCVFSEVSEGIKHWMANNDYTKLKQLVGAAHGTS